MTDEERLDQALRRVTPVYWAACHCYVWPLEPEVRIVPCGWCGEYPDLTVAEPPTGAAMPLDVYLDLMEGS